MSSGPWKGVYDTPDPFDSAPDRLRDAVNCYIPDPENGSGVYARNGFALGNNGTAITSGIGNLVGQAIYAHTQLDGSTINFCVIDGRVLRIDLITENAMTVTDVTPVGVSIQSGNLRIPVYLASMVAIIGGVTQSVLIVNDGTNRPWIGTNLTSTPITGTYIDYDGLGSAWVAFGPPRIWQGACFFVLRSVNGVNRAEDIAWSEPGRPDVGWQQSTFDNNMTLTQHSTGPLFALAATNAALFYFRGESIGVIYGDLGNLASTNTQDAVSVNVGCTNPDTMRQFGTAIFFCDVLGRPYRFTPGSDPSPIWKQMRTAVQAHGGTNDANNIRPHATSAIEPTRNLYLVGIWRDDAGAAPHIPVKVLYAFSAETGRYMGTWSVNDTGAGGVGIDTMGVLYASAGQVPTLVFLGEKTVGSGTLGFFWFFRVKGWSFPDDSQWLDGNVSGTVQHPNVQVVTDRIGESSDVLLSVDRVTLITGNASPCQVTVETPNTAGTIAGTPTPATSQDGTYRLTVGCDRIQGRGPSVTVAPQSSATTLDQWSLHRVMLVATPSPAGTEEP